MNEKSILAARVAWLLFAATSLQLAFLHPYLVLPPGGHINLFSGLLCALSLAATVWAATRADILRHRAQLAICLVLAVLILLSGLLSKLPGGNSWRGLLLLTSGLGGYWGARLLLATEARQRSFLWLCLVMLAGILLVILPPYLVTGNVPLILDSNPHPLANKIMLLWFAPLTLLWGRPAQKFWGAVLIGLSYLMFSGMELRSAVLLPLILGVLAVCFGGLRLKHLGLILLAAGVILFYFVRHLPKEKIGKEYEPAYYRVENYAFSWHIAVHHPLLGIGLLTPRDEFLQGYRIKYPYVTREQFENSLKKIIVADNMFLTFMAGVGFPFLLLFSFSLGALLTSLVRTLRAAPVAGVIPPLALLLPLVATLLSFFVYDILLHPQVTWFFSILLGLIPLNREEPAPRPLAAAVPQGPRT